MSEDSILIEGDLTNQYLAITKPTMDRIMTECENRGVKKCYVLALYNIYCYTAKWQKTNQPKCTTSYAAEATDMSESMVRKCKSILIHLGLIEDVQTTDKANRVVGHFIKVRYYIYGPKNKSHPIKNPQGGKTHSVEKRETNSYSNNRLNACSNNKEIPPISPKGEEGEVSDSVQAATPTPQSKPTGRSELQRRAGKLMRYTERRTWDKMEIQAWKSAKDVVSETTEEEWSLLEDFYALGREHNGEPTYSRTSLKTLLNNWNGEITRARDWFSKHSRPRSQEDIDRIEQAEADLTPVARVGQNEGRWCGNEEGLRNTEVTEETF